MDAQLRIAVTTRADEYLFLRPAELVRSAEENALLRCDSLTAAILKYLAVLDLMYRASERDPRRWRPAALVCSLRGVLDELDELERECLADVAAATPRDAVQDHPDCPPGSVLASVIGLHNHVSHLVDVCCGSCPADVGDDGLTPELLVHRHVSAAEMLLESGAVDVEKVVDLIGAAEDLLRMMASIVEWSRRAVPAPEQPAWVWDAHLAVSEWLYRADMFFARLEPGHAEDLFQHRRWANVVNRLRGRLDRLWIIWERKCTGSV